MKKNKKQSKKWTEKPESLQIAAKYGVTKSDEKNIKKIKL